MKRLTVLSAVAILLVAFFSCVPATAAESTGPERVHPTIRPPAPREGDEDVLDVIGGYLWNRFRDLADVVTLKLGWGTDRSLGAQLRLCYPLQVGAGIFEGYVLAIDHGCIGIMEEAEVEAGVSIYYPSWIARKVIWQTEEARKRNLFFGDVGEKGEVSLDAMKMYDDENQGWLTSTAQVQLPYLPKIEVTVNWGEIPDFVLSFFGLFRVPPKFHKVPGPDGEKGELIPAPSSIYWHGQDEEYERHE